MNYLAAWIHTPLAQALGWSLAHFVWEGVVLAVLLAVGLRLLRAAPAQWRYALACLTLAAMPVAFCVTLALTFTRRPAVVAVPVHWVATTMAAASFAAAPAPRFSWSTIVTYLPWLAPLWLAGVALLYARALAGWFGVQRMRRRGVCAPPCEWQARVGELAARLQIARPVALLESCLTDTPVLIGYLRPVILLPLGCLTGLSTAQVECILLHELAHVARHDYLVNLLQSLVEGLLFYHPAVWWVSRVVRTERENCCDDRAVELMGDARAYAATLAMIEQRRALEPALAASGGSLIRRIRRLTTQPGTTSVSAAPAISAGLLLVICAAALAALPLKTQKAATHRTISAPAALAVAVEETPRPAPQQRVAPAPAELTTPYRVWLNQDVVYIITDEERAVFLRLQTDEEREQFIKSFWLRRDPNSGTEKNEYRDEHYRRIIYANEQFASAIPGWKTDRGRIYIMYGPPDTIEYHPGLGRWTYRFIQGIGSNVVIEFTDRDGTGDFRISNAPEVMKEDPRPQANEAKVFAADGVSVIVPKAAAPSTIIAAGDLLDVTFAVATDKPASEFERMLAFQRQRCEELERKYTPMYPEVVKCSDQIDTLKAQLVPTSYPATPPRPSPSVVWIYAGAAGGFLYSSRVTVAPDGKIALDVGIFTAAGLTPSAVEAEIGRNATVHIVESATRLVTVVVPLASARDEYHVFAEVTVGQKIVQTFESDVNGQDAVARILPLRSGSYHLAAVVKNMASGAVTQSKLDFTVE
jgi:GWxTD domain-containing protein